MKSGVRRDCPQQADSVHTPSEYAIRKGLISVDT